MCVCGTRRDRRESCLCYDSPPRYRCETVERGGTPCVTCVCVSSVCFRSMSPPQSSGDDATGGGWAGGGLAGRGR